MTQITEQSDFEPTDTTFAIGPSTEPSPMMPSGVEPSIEAEAEIEPETLSESSTDEMAIADVPSDEPILEATATEAVHHSATDAMESNSLEREASAAPAAAFVPPAAAVAPAIAMRAIAEERAVPPISAAQSKRSAEPKARAVPPPPKSASGFRAGLVRHGIEAAALALAIGLGWIIGANTFDNSSEVHHLTQQTAALETRLAGLSTPPRPVANPVAGDVEGLRKAIETLQANAKNAKTSTDAARTAQTAALADISSRLDHLADDEQDAAKHLEEIDARMDRIDRLQRVATADLPTGSIAPVAVAPKTEPAAQPKVAAAIPPAAALPLPAARDPPAAAPAVHDADSDPLHQPMPPNGYVLRDVIDGSAVIESRAGVRTVKIGDVLPGAGKVQSIERRGRQWVVVTSGGVIDDVPY